MIEVIRWPEEGRKCEHHMMTRMMRKRMTMMVIQADLKKKNSLNI